MFDIEVGRPMKCFCCLCLTEYYLCGDDGKEKNCSVGNVVGRKGVEEKEWWRFLGRQAQANAPVKSPCPAQ